MTKEQTFEHPPRGHVALLYYDVTNDRFQVVQGDDVDTAIPAAGKSLLASTLAHGYDGSAWRKLALTWGYSERLAVRAVNLTATAGTNVLSISVVPAGEIWSVTRMVAVDLNSATTYIAMALIASAVEYRMGQGVALAANQSYQIQGPIVAAPGDVLRAIFGGCTLNDDLYVWATGYKMSIDM